MKSMDSPLEPGEKELFRHEKLRVIANGAGQLIVSTNVSVDARTYARAGMLHIEDEGVAITALAAPPMVMYREGNEPPVFIASDFVGTPEPIVGNWVAAPLLPQ